MKKHLTITIIFSFLIACTTQLSQEEIIKSSYKQSWQNIQAIAPIDSSYRLYWQDEFNGIELNKNVWKIRNNKRKKGYSSPNAVSVANGIAKITTYKKDDKYYGAIFDTGKKLSFKYGHFECRVKLQKQIGHWSAFWLNSITMGRILDNTKKSGTEIDVFEYLKREKDLVHHRLHWNGYKKHHQTDGGKAEIKGLQEGWHTFSVTWTDKDYTFYVDGKKVWHTNKAISQTSQYLIFSTEIGDWAGDIKKATLPDVFEIDYVRVFKKKDDSCGCSERYDPEDKH